MITVALLEIAGVLNFRGRQNASTERWQRKGWLVALRFAELAIFIFGGTSSMKGDSGMFGTMNVITVLDLRNAAAEVARSSEGAVARLLDATDHPKIEKWVQLPKALFVFLLVPGDPESGAFYVYDRRARVWYWVDFDDEKFGGYTVSDFDRLVRECRFLDLVEQPRLLTGKAPWIVTPGSRPQRSADATATTIAKSA